MNQNFTGRRIYIVLLSLVNFPFFYCTNSLIQAVFDIDYCMHAVHNLYGNNARLAIQRECVTNCIVQI